MSSDQKHWFAIENTLGPSQPAAICFNTAHSTVFLFTVPNMDYAKQVCSNQDFYILRLEHAKKTMPQVLLGKSTP